MKLLLATRNPGKLRELRRIIGELGAEVSGAEVSGAEVSGAEVSGGAGAGDVLGDRAGELAGAFEVLGLADVAEYPEAPETGATFAENALAKARHAVAATGLPAIADDSGLTVDALNGMPGVLSARWVGRHGDDVGNLELVLGQVADVPDARRGAAFVCAAALVLPDGSSVVEHGEWRGHLVRAPRGSNGFGYDPIFVPEGQSRTSAELSAEEKDAASHRGRAFRALLPALRALAVRG